MKERQGVRLLRPASPPASAPAPVLQRKGPVLLSHATVRDWCAWKETGKSGYKGEGLVR